MSHFSRALEQATRDRAHRAPDAAPEAGRPRALPARDGIADAGPAAPAPALLESPAESTSRVDDHLVSLLAPNTVAAEQYRALRHLIEQAHRTAGLSIAAISSANVGDGKTTTAINLAGALAQAADARVLLADLDLRRPAVGPLLGLSGSQAPGLIDAILDHRLGLGDVVVPAAPFNFSVLLAGRSADTPYELLKAPRLMALMEDARRGYDYVVIDTPPLLPVPDCQIIGKWVDAFLLVVTRDKTSRTLLGEALNVLPPDKIMGLVFNRNDQLPSGYGYYGREGPRPGSRGGWIGAVERVADFFHAASRQARRP